MSKYKTNFKASKVFNSKHLDTIVKSNVEGKTTSYYLITNSWDGVCNYFNERLPNDGVTDLNVVDIFNVPNAWMSLGHLSNHTERQFRPHVSPCILNFQCLW